MNEVKNLVNLIVAGAQEKKAKNIVTVDISSFPGAICKYFVICEGNTPTQVTAITDQIAETVRIEGKEKPITVDGQREARWVGMDYGTVIVHIFIPELRSFYDIEHLWEDAKLEQIPDID